MLRNLKLINLKLINSKLTNQSNSLSSLSYLRSFVDHSRNCLNSIKNQRLLRIQIVSACKYSVNLTENQYERLVEETLESLNDYFDELLEKQTKITNYDLTLSDGVLTINLDPFGTYVINKQTPNKQIWISSPISGPKRYDYMDGVWIYKHDNCSLHDLLNHEITSILELTDIDFKNCVELAKSKMTAICGLDQEFPYLLEGKVIRGYQRGTKDLGVPTANLDGEEVKNLKLLDGIYYGWAKILDDTDHIYPMSASIGNNPTYGNPNRSLEIHLMDQITDDLYDKHMKVVFGGFIRPQLSLKTIDELKKAIQNDIQVSIRELEKSGAKKLKAHKYLN